MSNTGKTSTYIRKTSVKESTVPNTGFKKTRFLHEAAEGDTLIQLSSLTPPTDAVGYSAPNVSELTQTNLMQWASNVTLTSSLRGVLIQNLSYVMSGASTIKLLFEAEEGEVFEGIIDHSVKTGLTMVDAAPLVVSGTLAAGDTDFNVGVPYKVGAYPSAKRGVVQVEIDGQPAYRTDGNAAFGPGISGDYYEVHSGDGLGQILRFNPDLTNDRFIMVTSVGALVERPNGSVMAVMETIQGQIDAMIPTLAELAEVDETDFQAAPNNTDLKSFGDKVHTLEQGQIVQDARLDELEIPTQHEIWLQDLASGSDFGSVGTRIRRFDTVRRNVGTSMTLNQSASNGDSVTINDSGLYAVMFISQFNAAIDFGISLNASSTSTDITSLVDEEIIAITEGGGADFPSTSSVTLWLNPGDVVRPHVDSGTLSFTKNGVHQFRIVKVR